MPRWSNAVRALSITILGAASASLCEAQSWTAPIGVPVPPFGVTQVAGPFTHYIDNTHPSATDTSNPNGTPTKPRLTVPTSLAAGSVVEVHGGPYSYTSSFRWTSSGTSANPVFVRGVGQPVLTRGGSLGDLVLTGTYTVVEGFVFDGMRVRLNGNSVALRSSEVKNFSPTSNDAAVSGSGTNLVFYRNHVHHNGDATGLLEVDLHAFKFISGSSSIWVVDNNIHENGGDEIQLGDASSAEPWVHHVYFGRNVGYGSRENCVDIKRARDVVISQNDCSGYAASSSSAGEAVVIHNSPDRVWIIGNKIHDSARGIVASSNLGAQPVYVIGNAIYGIRHAGTYDPSSLWAAGHAIQAWATPTLHIVNNTIHDVDAGIAYADGYSAQVRIVNNVIGRLLQPSHHVGLPSTAVSQSTISNTLMLAPSRIKWGSTTNVLTVAQLKSQYPSQCGGCTDADPLFVNAASYDLRIGTGSPNIDRGFVDPVYSTFQSLYGLDIRRDPAGTARPQGAAWDIGAYEFLSAGTSFLLTATKAGTGSGTVTSSPAGISCGTDCSQAYSSGTVVTLSQTATTGSSFAGWSGACTGTGTCQVTMSAARSVTATFNVTYNLTVAKVGTGTGTVTSSPAGISCGTDCSQAYNPGTLVTLSRTAATGSSFAGWSGACTGTGTCQVTMSAARFVTATFTLALRLTSITPVSGSIAGGATVTIRGQGFTVGATVAIGGVPASGIVVTGPTSLTAVTRPNATGLANVTVTIPGPESATLVGAFAYAPPPTPADFYTLKPCRLVDTRVSGSGPALSAFERRVWTLTGRCDVPATATALALNLTVVGPTAPGNIRLMPGNGLTESSAINFSPGKTRANAAVVMLATDLTGGLAATNGSNGVVHVILDVSGYFE